MENKKSTPEQGKTSATTPNVTPGSGSNPSVGNPTGHTPSTTTSPTSSTGQTGGTGSTSGQTGYSAGATTQRAREQGSENRVDNEGGSRANQVLDQTKQVVTQAYDKTAETLSNTYGQAMSYGRENPGALTLIAFGAGIGIGLLLASGFGGRSRTSRIAEPVVNALSQVAMEIFR